MDFLWKGKDKALEQGGEKGENQGQEKGKQESILRSSPIGIG